MDDQFKTQARRNIELSRKRAREYVSNLRKGYPQLTFEDLLYKPLGVIVITIAIIFLVRGLTT